MNRLEEINQMKMDIDNVPEKLDMPMLTHRVKKRVWRHRVVASVRNTVIALVILVGGMAVGVNSSQSFADSVKSIPVLNKLAQAVDFSRGYEDAIREEYVTKIGQVAKTKYGDVVLAYAMADDSSLVMFLGGNWEKEGRELVLSNLIDADTGKDTGHSGLASVMGNEEEDLKVLDPKWSRYHKNVTVEFELQEFEGEDYKVLDKVSFTFSTEKKLKSRIFTPKTEFCINGFSYRIDKVVMHPLSTEVEVTFLDDVGKERYQTLDMRFSLSGEEELRGRIENHGASVIGRDLGDGRQCYYLESGYYMLDSEVALCLDEVCQLPEELQEITYDSKNKTLTDKKGEMKNITVIGELSSTDGFEGKCLKVKPTMKMPDSFGWMNLFTDVKKPDGSWLGAIDRVESDSEYAYFPIEDDYKDADGKITFLRGYPEYVEKTDIKVPLK